MTTVGGEHNGEEQSNESGDRQGCRSPRIFAIRHGESVWNVLHKQHPTEEERYHPRMWTVDCGLTERGVAQAKTAGKQMAQTLPKNVDLVVISPLRRALDTARIALEEYSLELKRKATETTKSASSEAQTAKTAYQVSICKDAAEVMVDPCDIGSTPSELAVNYPQLNFSHLDEYWWHGSKSPPKTLALMKDRKGRETDASAQKRIEQRFKETFLRRQSERYSTIVVVCHSDTIWWLTREQKENGEHFGMRVDNGELVDITEYVLSNPPFV